MIITRATSAVKRHGVRKVPYLCARYLRHQLNYFHPQRMAARRLARAWDNEHGISTDGIVPVSSLPDLNCPVAYRYEPTNIHTFREVMTPIAPEISDHTFIDFGSGKGRALLLATDYPFAEIIGVEISAELHAVAQQNVASFGEARRTSCPIQCVCGDAGKFEVPERPSVYYFFNPFGAPVMREVLANIERRNGHCLDRSFSIYANPDHAEVFSETDRWKIIATGQASRHRYVIYRGVSG